MAFTEGIVYRFIREDDIHVLSSVYMLLSGGSISRANGGLFGSMHVL